MQKSRQAIVGMVYLSSSMSGASAGRLERSWNRGKNYLLIYPVGFGGCQLGVQLELLARTHMQMTSPCWSGFYESRVPRRSVLRETELVGSCISFYNLAFEVRQHYFYHIFLVQAVTNVLSGRKERNEAPPLTEENQHCITL